MAGVDRDVMFVALTRPQMFAGVTYSYFIINGVISTELFLVFHSVWVILGAVLTHIVGVVLSVREPRIFELWLTRVRHCPRVRNYKIWRCNSYRP